MRWASAPASRSIGGTVDAFASYHGAGLLEPGDAYDPGGSAGGFGVYWDHPVEVAGAFVTPAPLAGRFSVGAAMAATGRALDWYRDASSAAPSPPRRCSRRPPPPRPAPTASSSCRTSPASDRRCGTRPRAACFAGLTLAHGRGHVARAILEASALAIRHVATPMLAAGVRVTRDARLRRPGPERRLERDQGRRHRVPGRRPGGARDRGPRLRDPRRGRDRRPSRCRGGHRGDDPVDHRIEPDPATRETYERLFEAYVALYPATAPILRSVSA